MTSALRRTSAAARAIAQHAPVALTRTRALLLDQQLIAYPTNPTPGLLRQIVLAIRTMTGPDWLARHVADPAILAFTALDTMAAPPPLPILDHTLAHCLQARFPPTATQPPDSPQESARHRG
jgi:hypothetical protein